MPTRRNKGTITIPKDKLPSKPRKKKMVIPKKKIENAIRPKAVAKPKPKMKLNITSMSDPKNKTMRGIRRREARREEEVPIAVGVGRSAFTTEAIFNPRQKYVRISEKDQRKTKDLPAGTYKVRKEGQFFKGDGFTIGLLGSGQADNHGLNIVDHLKHNRKMEFYAYNDRFTSPSSHVLQHINPLR